MSTYKSKRTEEQIKERKKEIQIAMENITPQMMLDFFEQRIIGQHKELKMIVYMLYKYLQMASEDVITDVPSWLLTAPSGCGKTEVYRTLKAFCAKKRIPVPVVHVDLSQITEAGFQGKEANTIIHSLALEDSVLDGIGICFLDEADKKFAPSHNSVGEDSNAKAQSNLLTVIEGTIENIPLNSGGAKQFDSNQTMFVLMGAFQDLRNSKQKRIQTTDRGIGFICRDVQTSTEDVFYEDITLEDMIEFGMLEEIAGRMQMVVNLHKLSREDMRDLILSKIHILEQELNIPIEFDDNTINSLLDISYSNLGVRRVTNCLRTLAFRAISEVFYDKAIDSNCCLVIKNTGSAYIKFEGENHKDSGVIDNGDYTIIREEKPYENKIRVV